MITKIELNKYDIKTIIAEHFNVMEHQVEIDCYMDTRGYGMAEEQVPDVRVEVTMN